MTIAIAILNWNGKTWLEKFLPSVIRHSSGAEIFVIDNASTDDSIVFLKDNFPEVNIIQNKVNSGFAAGYNEGLKLIRADIYCLLNSDVEVTEKWLSPIINLFTVNKDIAAVQPKILDYNQKKKFEFAGAAGGLIDNLGYPYCRGRVFDDIEFDNGQYDDETERSNDLGFVRDLQREAQAGHALGNGLDVDDRRVVGQGQSLGRQVDHGQVHAFQVEFDRNGAAPSSAGKAAVKKGAARPLPQGSSTESQYK